MEDKNTSMKIDNHHSRRQFLKLTGHGTLGLMAREIYPGFGRLAAGQTQDTQFVPDLDISLSARPDEVAVFPGNPTRVWRYHATMHKGDQARVVEMPHSYLGPGNFTSRCGVCNGLSTAGCSKWRR
jgi:hypothetical protein